jgi:hypothetical protein
MSLLQALATRHADAVFVGECKMGPQGSRRLDAWVLLKTWSPPTTIGYEIKENRSDFLRDRKWSDYLPVCHELYFVSPAKLIQPEELPQDVGLLWQVGGGERLVTKRKAARRQPDAAALTDLMTYVLMSRTRVVGDMWEANREDRGAAFWRRWLSERRESKDLGYDVSKRIREELNKAREAQRQAEYDRDRLLSVKEKLAELGLGERASAHDLEARANGRAMKVTLENVAYHAKRIVELSANGGVDG